MAELVSIGEFLHPQPVSFEQQTLQRVNLVEQLISGIPVEIDGSRLKFTLKEKYKTDTYVYFEQDGQELGWVGAVLDKKSKTASRMGKDYEVCIPEGLKKRGLISASSALLFQYLISEQFTQIEGVMVKSNTQSLRVRLNTPDLIRGGYFYTTLSQDSSKGFIVVRTNLSTDIPALEKPLNEVELMEKFRKENPPRRLGA